MRIHVPTFIFLFVCIGIAVALAGCVYFDERGNGEEDEEIVFPCQVEVVNKTEAPQLVSSKETLDFGMLPVGMSEQKDIVLKNNKNYTVTLSPEVNGSISQWISYSTNEIIIDPHDSAVFAVYITIPDNALKGIYTGYLKFTVTKNE